MWCGVFSAYLHGFYAGKRSNRKVSWQGICAARFFWNALNSSRRGRGKKNIPQQIDFVPENSRDHNLDVHFVEQASHRGVHLRLFSGTSRNRARREPVLRRSWQRQRGELSSTFHGEMVRSLRKAANLRSASAVVR
jgi:hypothetical protein